MQNSMSTVFKYSNAHGLNILTNLELKVTPPNQFNDPFEFMAHTICSKPLRWANQYFNEEKTRELWTSCLLEGSFKGDLIAFQKQFKSNRPRFINEWIIPQMNRAIVHAQNGAIDDISKALGVVCLSRKWDSLLMWGHYCDKHQGIVIGFDDTATVFKSGLGLRAVEYESARIPLDLSAILPPKDKDKLNDRIMFTKNEEWSYEKEVRQIFHLRSMRQRKMTDGKIGYFCPIPPEAIVSVYLGVKCSSTLEADVQAALAAPQLSHVRLSRVHLHDSEFRLDCV